MAAIRFNVFKTELFWFCLLGLRMALPNIGAPVGQAPWIVSYVNG